jgi:hypothetical protein
MVATKSELVDLVQGQTFVVDDIRRIPPPSWPLARHVEYERMRSAADKFFD